MQEGFPCFLTTAHTQQDIATIAERLPCLPEDLDMVIIRQDGVNMAPNVPTLSL